MSLDEAIADLISMKDYYNDKNEDSYVGFDDEDNEAIGMAIRVLRILQAMEDLYKWEDNDGR